MPASGSDVPRALPIARTARPRGTPAAHAALDVAWQRRGASREAEPRLFYPPENEDRHRKRFREAAAKAVCAACPVRAACRAFALATAEPYGIRGGAAEAERYAARSAVRRRDRQPA
jgi:WhiB family redox-sensing transcriptional regulator